MNEVAKSWAMSNRIIREVMIGLGYSQHRAEGIASAILARLAKEYLLVVHCDEVEFKADLEAAKEQRPPRVGDRIKVTKDIEWDGEDCHPPCTLAFKGDLMHVRKIRGFNVMACHNELDTKTMLVVKGEYEIVSR